jgi:hypothetical protein
MSRLVMRKVDLPQYGGRVEYQVVGAKGAVALTLIEYQIEGTKKETPDAINFHSPVPAWVDHYRAEDCHILEGACYPDWSYGQAFMLYQEWLGHEKDEQYLYAALAERYMSWFEDEDEEEEEEGDDQEGA